MHPRAANFNPEADEGENADCSFYQLGLNMQHYASHLSNDTLKLGNWIYDADATPFYLINMPILASGLHLYKAGSGNAFKSIETIALQTNSGAIVHVEDNFFITEPNTYSYNIAGWTELGTFDSLSFYIGLPDAIRSTVPSKITETSHPLSTTASYYMYDSTSSSYQSCKIVIKQPLSGNEYTFSLFDYIPINLPYNITAADGEDVPIRLRLDYVKLFDGISFSNDSQSTVETKLVQNFPGAFSTY